MLVPIRMGTNMAAANQQKHLSLSFATKACICPSRNSKTFTLPRVRGNVLSKALFGKAPPQGPTPYLLYTVFTEKVALSYTFN